MKRSEMKKLTKHFDKYFEQNECTVIHPVNDEPLHIDVLLYGPNEKYPFWKLVTMGASDYMMPEFSPTVSRFNEYILFVDQDQDLTNKEIASYYYNKLYIVATYAYHNMKHITFEHSFEFINEDPNDAVVGVYVTFPMLVEDVGVLRCEMDRKKTVACLEAVLLNRKELDLLLELGPTEFCNSYLYPSGAEE